MQRPALAFAVLLMAATLLVHPTPVRSDPVDASGVMDPAVSLMMADSTSLSVRVDIGGDASAQLAQLSYVTRTIGSAAGSTGSDDDICTKASDWCKQKVKVPTGATISYKQVCTPNCCTWCAPVRFARPSGLFPIGWHAEYSPN